MVEAEHARSVLDERGGGTVELFVQAALVADASQRLIDYRPEHLARFGLLPEGGSPGQPRADFVRSHALRGEWGAA